MMLESNYFLVYDIAVIFSLVVTDTMLFFLESQMGCSTVFSIYDIGSIYEIEVWWHGVGTKPV